MRSTRGCASHAYFVDNAASNSRVRFVEVPRENLPTCTFNNNTFEIRVGDDKWDSGCVPHELGHAVLWVLGHPCWDNFEHPNQTPTRCE